MAAHIDTTKVFAATIPQPLFRTGLTEANTDNPNAVAKDGRRFSFSWSADSRSVFAAAAEGNADIVLPEDLLLTRRD
jgi:hypothetical protein